MARVRLLIIATGLLLAACGGEETPVAVQAVPASLADLTGPWQAQPLALDPGFRSQIEQGCRRDMERRPESVAALVDVRGASVAVVRMVGPGAGMCDALEITLAGQVQGAGGGWTAGDAEQLAPIGPAELAEVQYGSIGGGSLKVQGYSVVGRAGADIAAVMIEPDGIPPIMATLENGWFAGWWPSIVPPNQLGNLPPPQTAVVRGYDAAGALLDEASPQ